MRKEAQYNRIRSAKVSGLRRENIKLVRSLERYIDTEKINDEDQMLRKYILRLYGCSHFSLYRDIKAGTPDITYVSSFTCDHKLCLICNMIKSKMIRRKYMKFLSKDNLLTNYDLMHLTLTVPHNENGFRGVRYYGVTLKKAFNEMRKKKYRFWAEYVYAGEYGVEMTKGKNALHIHIHSLLLVFRVEQSRNKLHREILLMWNRLTMDHTATRQVLSDQDKEAIMRGNKLLTTTDVNNLHPKGSTMIGLESLYVYRTGKDGTKRKSYVRPVVVTDTAGQTVVSNMSAVMGGVMECIKYHFEPMALKNENEDYNAEFICEALPLLYRQPLYAKFGAFYGEKELNFNTQEFDKEEFEAILKETAGEGVRHPVTGEPLSLETMDYSYFIADPKSVYHGDEKKPVIDKKRKIELPEYYSVLDAGRVMLEMAIDKRRVH